MLPSLSLNVMYFKNMCFILMVESFCMNFFMFDHRNKIE